MLIPDDTIIDDGLKIRSLIGVGGMGSVYRAVQTNLNREVAVKLINGHAALDSAIWERLRREALILSKLHNNNIVAFYKFGKWRDRPFIVMELAHGSSLQSLLASSTRMLSLQQLLQLMKPLCDALSYAHSQGIIHRDLKPGNILLLDEFDSPAFSVKVIDFGLAKFIPELVQSLPELTQPGATVGTVLYMSPEQCRGEQLDLRSDIYSLGAILYECISATCPFVADNAASVMMAHRDAAVPPIPAAHATLTPHLARLQEIIGRCMAKDRSLRYESADSVFSALSELQEPQVIGRANFNDLTLKDCSWQIAWALTFIATLFAAYTFHSTDETRHPEPKSKLNLPVVAERSPAAGRPANETDATTQLTVRTLEKVDSLVRKGELERAESLGNNLLTLVAQSNPESPALIPILEHLKQVYMKQDRWAMADSTLQQIDSLQQKCNGPDSADAAESFISRAHIIEHFQGRDRSIAALQARLNSITGSSQEAQYSRSMLNAALCTKMSDPLQGSKFAEASLANLKLVRFLNREEYLQLYANIGSTLVVAKKVSGACEAYERYMYYRGNLAGIDDLSILKYLDALASVEVNCGYNGRAEQVVCWALHICGTNPRANVLLPYWTAKAIVPLLRQGKVAEAEQAAKQLSSAGSLMGKTYCLYAAAGLSELAQKLYTDGRVLDANGYARLSDRWLDQCQQATTAGIAHSLREANAKYLDK
jgi:serine/threonine protein kinase